MNGNILSVDIGGTKFGLALSTRDGSILAQRGGATNTAGGASWMIEEIYRNGSELIAGGGAPVAACGIGFGGPVDFHRQVINRSMHVRGWGETALADLLGERFHIPAIVDNDANTAALGEVYFGAARGARNIVYLTVSTGIGGGIIIDGKIYHGAHSFAGECGHVTLVPDGPLCSCGKRGCLEALCSGTAIARQAQAALAGEAATNWGRTKVLREMAGDEPGNITAKLVFEAAQAGDGLAASLVNKVCVYLGIVAANLINLFDPEMVVIGGGVAKAGGLLFDPLNHEIEKHVMPLHGNRFKCVPAALGDDSVLLGAVALANNYCLDNRRDEQRRGG